MMGAQVNLKAPRPFIFVFRYPFLTKCGVLPHGFQLVWSFLPLDMAKEKWMG